MKRHLTIEDISAFLDGEHDRPERVQKHLQQCAECAKQHVAMQKLSAHVRALPEPQVTFGFQARVMRAIETPEPARTRRIARFWMPLGTGLAAMLAVMISLSSPNSEGPAITREARIDHSPGVAVDLAGVLGPDGSERDSFGGYPEVQGDMQIALASAAGDRPVPSGVFRGTDYNESLFALDASEKETLIQLLGSSVIDEHMM